MEKRLTLAERMSRIAQARGCITQQELGAKLGISQQAVNNWLAKDNPTRPSRKNILRFCKEFDVSEEDLMDPGKLEIEVVTHQEQKLLKLFRKLNEQRQQASLVSLLMLEED